LLHDVKSSTPSVRSPVLNVILIQLSIRSLGCRSRIAIA